MNENRIEALISLLNKEVKPAMGCTEPISVALACAKAASFLPRPIDQIKVSVSGNVLKNGMSVGIPGTGMEGIPIAASLGAVGGNADALLQVIAHVTPQQVEQAKYLVAEKKVSIEQKDTPEKLYIEATVFAGADYATAIIAASHTNFVYLSHNHTVILDTLSAMPSKNCGICSSCDRECNERKIYTTIAEIWDFALTTPLDRISFLLDGAAMNSKIAEEGLKGYYGLQVGRTIMENIAKNVLKADIATSAMAFAAAGSDARMAGCAMPVMSNSGSGNQGITVMNPVISAAKTLGSKKEDLIRGLAISNLVSIHLKTYLGELSALCGAVTAATGAGCGIVYLMGGNLVQVYHTIKNMIGNIAGMICDGAKPGCALKVATAVNAAVQSAILALDNIEVSEYDGIIEKDIEKTIKNLGLLGSVGMEQTDKLILKIMTCK